MLYEVITTMYEAPGVGLAAPQVGILKRVIVFDIQEKLYEMINPEIFETEGEQIEVEGCLSVPGKYGRVERPAKIKVRYQDRNGETNVLEAEGLEAVVICHETDHLEGKLFTDIVIDYRITSYNVCYTKLLREFHQYFLRILQFLPQLDNL